MTERMRQIDEVTQQLLKETYQRVKPSPEFKQRLFQQLVTETRSRQSPIGWLARVRSLLAGPSTSGWSPSRRVAISLIGLALLVLVVGGAVWAMWGRPGGIPAWETAPAGQAPDAVGTPTLQPASPTPTTEQPAHRQPTLTAATSEQALPTATPEMPMAQPSEPPLLPDTATPTPRPTATPTPTEVPSTAIPTREGAASTPPPPTATPASCRARIVGAAWEDVNGNGRRDQGDLSLGGVTVTLQDKKTGRIVGTVTTGADGHYGFDNLPAGRYHLQAAPPAGYRAITPQAWGEDLECATIGKDFGYQPKE